MDQNLIALYEIKRLTFLTSYIQNPDRFSDSLAFAYFNRLAPIFHENMERETYGTDPYEEIYAVKGQFIQDVLKHVDELWLAKNLSDLGFYKLEDTFGGYKANRVELIWALEYARIDGRFNDEVWAAIESDAPSEANSLDATFSPEDVHFS